MKDVVKMSMLVASAMVLLSVGGCVTAKQKMMDAGEKPLTDQELQTLFGSAPTDTEVITHNGNKSYVNHFPDGSQTIRYSGGSDDGKYWIEDGGICGQWQTINNRAVRCSSVFKTTDNQYKLFDAQGNYFCTINFR